MHDYLRTFGASRIHWRYDDPSGLPDTPSRVNSTPGGRAASELRVRARTAQIMRIN